jgi:hypothetical protein
VKLHTKGTACPICEGSRDLPQGHGVRCWGYTSDDGDYAHCTREELAGGEGGVSAEQLYTNQKIVDLVSKAAFLLVWVLFNFCWLALFRRPVVAALISLEFVVALSGQRGPGGLVRPYRDTFPL